MIIHCPPSKTPFIHQGAETPVEVRNKFQELQDAITKHGTLVFFRRTGGNDVKHTAGCHKISLYNISKYKETIYIYIYHIFKQTRFASWGSFEVPIPKLPENFALLCLKSFFKQMKIGRKVCWWQEPVMKTPQPNVVSID